MEDRRITEHFSSWIVNRWVILFWFLFFIIAVLYDRTLLSAFFLVVFLISLFSRLWSKYSLNNIYLNITSSSQNIFPDQEIVLSFHFENRKFWPLIWVQLNLPLSKNNAVLPVDDEDIYRFKTDQEDYSSFYIKRVAWILWFQNVSWQNTWKGTKRGFYAISSAVVSSGDGFGLAAVEKVVDLKDPKFIIVYPALVPVDTSSFKSIWGERMGSGGLVEDTTLLRTTRDYQIGDSWKHINWRLAALNKPLQVNIYEKVTYQTIHFYLDVISFFNKHDELEDALSILASIILELDQKNVSVALTLPPSISLPKQYYMQRSDSEHLFDMLKALSMIILEESSELLIDEHDLFRDKSSEQIYWISYDYNDKKIPEDFIRKIHSFLCYEDNMNYSSIESYNTKRCIISLKNYKL